MENLGLFVGHVMGRDIMVEASFFKLYDKLIDGIEDGILVEDYNYGDYWTSIRAGEGLGLAKRFDQATRPRQVKEDYIGQDLKKIAELSKSWNLEEASVGLAAINCYYNSSFKQEKLGLAEAKGDAFEVYKEDVRGKKVTVVGHFPFLEKQLEGVCDLRILERNPQPGDYPDSACEVLLPESDYVFITSCTIVNKTFPRLVDLAKGARIIMVGPSTPMAGFLLEEGIFDLSGFIPTDIQGCINSTLNPECKGLFHFGDRVSLNKL